MKKKSTHQITNEHLSCTHSNTHRNKSRSYPSYSSQLSESSIKLESLKCSIRVKPCTSRRLSLYMPLGSASFLPSECCNSLPTPHNPSASALPPAGPAADPWLPQPHHPHCHSDQPELLIFMSALQKQQLQRRFYRETWCLRLFLAKYLMNNWICFLFIQICRNKY